MSLQLKIKLRYKIYLKYEKKFGYECINKKS